MKSRYWSFIAYPESIKENWIEYLETKGVQFAISPLHDKDIDLYTEEGPKKKKEHWHVLLEYEGPKTYKSIKEEITQVIGATEPKKVESIRGYYRYFTHMDNPEKAQYKSEDIKEYNGFKLELTNTETTRIKNKICEEICEKKIYEYAELIDYYRDIGDNDFLEIASNHTYFFTSYLSSKRNSKKESQIIVKKNDNDLLTSILK